MNCVRRRRGQTFFRGKGPKAGLRWVNQGEKKGGKCGALGEQKLLSFRIRVGRALIPTQRSIGGKNWYDTPGSLLKNNLLTNKGSKLGAESE